MYIKTFYCLLHYLGTPEQPMVILPKSPISLLLNTFNLSMSCQPNKSYLTYTWEKKGEFPSKILETSLSTLTITNVKPNDSGEYRCIVSNSTGKIASEYAMLIVRGNYYCVHIYNVGQYTYVRMYV